MNLSAYLNFKSAFSKKNLLLANGYLCIGYAFVYIFLIILPYCNVAQTNKFYAGAVLIVNLIFLVTMCLNLNTIMIIYSELARPRKKYIRIIYSITLIVWLFYVFSALYFTLFLPGFIFRFHHYVSFSFRFIGWRMVCLSGIFVSGLIMLFREYYKQISMTNILYFIIPSIILFSFKSVTPSIINLLAWVVYAGSQLLLYFSIVDGASREWQSEIFIPERRSRFSVN